MWKMLSGDLSEPLSLSGIEEEAALLLCKLFTVPQFSTTVEEALLEEFATKVLLWLQLLSLMCFYLSCLAVFDSLSFDWFIMK